jgi:hypothetical protein
LIRTWSEAFVDFREITTIKVPVGKFGKISVMGFGFADSFVKIKLLIRLTMTALFREHIKDRIWRYAVDTCLRNRLVKRRFLWAIGDVVENEGSLSVLLFKVLHGLRAEDPVFSFKVRLENSRSKVLFALDVEDILHFLQHNQLLLNVVIHMLHLGLILAQFFVDILQFGYLAPCDF